MLTMSDEGLRASLEVMLHKRYERSFALQREYQERLQTLSDEEWWQQQAQALNSRDSRMEAITESAKEYMIEHRLERLKFLNGDGLQLMVQAEVEKVMPELIRLRLELNEDGPLTDEQYQAASIRSSQSQIAEMSVRLKQAVERQTDPRRRDILAMFASNVELDIEDLKALSDPEISQEQLDVVTSKMTERMNSLTASVTSKADGAE